MNRVIRGDKSSDIIAMTMMLYGLPRVIRRADAIVVLPGLGEMWRLTDAIRAWEHNAPAARYLLITGHNQREKTWVHFTLDNLNLKRRDGVYIEAHAEHTKEQAEWIIGKVQDLKISSLALFVSPYHLLRAYCTILRTFIRLDVPNVPMIPIPVAISPDTTIPEINVDAWEMVKGEVKRLIAYQEKDDVATYRELRDYLSWLWKHHLLQV